MTLLAYGQAKLGDEFHLIVLDNNDPVRREGSLCGEIHNFGRLDWYDRTYRELTPWTRLCQRCYAEALAQNLKLP